MNEQTVTLIAAIIAAVGVIFAAIASVRSNIIKGRKDREIAELRPGHELLIEYDKDLLQRRIACYEKLLALMLSLAKYPEPDKVTFSKLTHLAISLRRWYYDGGGLYMTEQTRDKYFDLQDGFKILIQRHEKRWPPASGIEELGKYLGRDILSREVPSDVEEIAKCQADVSGEIVPEVIFSRIRSLGSAVRTSMTEDILTRRTAYLKTPNG